MEQAPVNASEDATPTTLYLTPEDQSGTRRIPSNKREATGRDDERTEVFQTPVNAQKLEQSLSVEPTLGDLTRESQIVQDVAPREKTLLSTSWWKDAAALAKATTLDKWLQLKELGERKDQKAELQKKNEDIARITARAAELEKSIVETRAVAQKEKEEAATFAAGLASEELTRIFAGAVEKSAAKTANDLQAKENERIAIGLRMTTLLQEKDTFQSAIVDTEKRLTQRIDGKVDEIKRTFLYDQQVEQRATLETAIQGHRATIEANKQKIASYQKALIEGAKFLEADPEAKAKLEDIIDQMADQVAEQTEQLQQAQKIKTGLENNLAAIEKKIGKWDRVRESYGLVSPAAKAAGSRLQNIEESSPETGVAAPTATSIEASVQNTTEQETGMDSETVKQLIAYCEGSTEDFMKNQQHLEDTLWESSKISRKNDQFIRDAYKTIGNLARSASEADIREAMNEIKFSLLEDLRINTA